MSLLPEEKIADYLHRIIQDLFGGSGMVAQKRRTRVDKQATTRKLMKAAIEALPPQLKEKGWLLVQHLDQNRCMLSPQGEFIPYGQIKPICGSHINELIRYTLSKKRSRPEPTGFAHFLQQIKHYPMEPGLISSHHHASPTQKSKRPRKIIKMDVSTQEEDSMKTAFMADGCVKDGSRV